MNTVLIILCVLLLVCCFWLGGMFITYKRKYKFWKGEAKILHEEFTKLWCREQLKDSPYPECAYCLKFKSPVSGDVYLLRHTNGICEETGEPTKGSNVCECFMHDPLPIS